MKRMIKRILAFFMVIVTFSSSVASVYGAENDDAGPSHAKIRAATPDNDYKLDVYKAGGELMFSMEDLAVLTGYSYEYEASGGCCDLFYTRGEKSLELYLESNRMWPVLEGETIAKVEFETPPIQIGTTWYLPGSEILPWMNVFCFEQDGVFYVYPDQISYYDIVKDFKMKDYTFDFYDACEKIGISGNNLRVTTFFKRQGISGTIKHGFSVDDDPFNSYGSYETFYDVLELFMSNRNAALPAVETYEKEGGILDFGTSFWEKMAKCENMPAEAQFFSTAGESLKIVELGVELANFYSIFYQDNELKLGIMKKIWNGRYEDIHYDNTVRAAKSIYEAYTNFWVGILLTANNVVEDEVIDELVEKAVGYLTGTELLVLALDAVELATDLAISWDEAIDNIRIYEYIMPSCKKYYEEVYDRYDYTAYAIEDRIGNAILYLHSVEMCYRGMAEYMDIKRRGGGGLINEYNARADEALEWQGKFLAVYQARLNDSTDRNSFGEDGIARSGYSKYLRDEFEKVDTMNSAPMELAYIEYAFVLQGLKDTVNHNDYKWHIMDIDGDGGKELVVGLDFETSGYPSQLLCDAGSVTCWYQQRTSVNGSSMYVAAADGSTIYLHDGDISVDFRTNNYLRWNGVDWEAVGVYDLYGVEEGGEYSFEEGGMVSQYDGEISWMGESLTESEYYAKAEQETDTLAYECPDLSDFTILGDSTALLEEIENYFKGRSNYQTSTREDINQDGDEDLLIAIGDAVQYWFGYIESETGCFEGFADYEGKNLTILAAETVEDGVRIRFINRPLEDFRITYGEEAYNLDGTTLTIGNQVLNYNETGKVYTAEGDEEEYDGAMDDIGIDDYPDHSTLDAGLPEEEAVTLMDLVFMEKRGVRQSLETYQEQGAEQDYGSLYGTPVTIQYDTNGSVRSVTAENTGGYAQIVGAFPLDSAFADLWYMIPSISDWSDPVVTQQGYTTAFVYQDAATGMEAYCELTFDGIEQDSNVVMMYIQWN